MSFFSDLVDSVSAKMNEVFNDDKPQEESKEQQQPQGILKPATTTQPEQTEAKQVKVDEQKANTVKFEEQISDDDDMLAQIAKLNKKKNSRKTTTKKPVVAESQSIDTTMSTKKRPKKLPRDFAEQVQELELQIDESEFSSETVDQLMELYQMAITYYNGYNSTKYQKWESRMQNFFLKPQILNMLTGRKVTPENTARTNNRKSKRTLAKEKHAQNKAETQKVLAEVLAYNEKQDDMAALEAAAQAEQERLDNERVKEEQRMAMVQAKVRNRMSIDKRFEATLERIDEAKLAVTNDMDIQQNALQERLAKRRAKKKAQESQLSFDSLINDSSVLEYSNVTEEEKKDNKLTDLSVIMSQAGDEEDLPDVSDDEREEIGRSISNFSKIDMVDDTVSNISQSSLYDLVQQKEAELEKLFKEQQAETEDIIEEMTAQKYQKFAEIKSKYDMQLKIVGANKEQIDKLIAKRDAEKAECSDKMNKLKKEALTALEQKYAVKREELSLENTMLA